ncbi:MAG: LysR family transcriptional regulator [Coriobacteriales bacterium]|jgi:DNA-binding transcriptional LysR family regulator|nr:LysR family transcriptional regulator [Coriobacteriales bacterium]
MRIDHMREFCTVARLKSFSAASRKLFVSQSALSRHVLAMEEELGCKLLLHRQNAFELTQQGEKTAEAFTELVHDYDRFVMQLQQQEHCLDGRLSIGVFPNVVDEYAFPVVKDLKLSHPRLKLEFRSGLAQDLLNELKAGEIDIAMTVVVGTPTSSGLHYSVVSNNRFIALLSEGHLLAARDTLALDDLADECILLHSDEVYATCALSAMRRCGFVPGRHETTLGIQTVQFSILETGGVFITSAALGKLQFSGIVARPISDADMFCKVAYAYQKSNPNPAIPLFLRSQRSIGQV